MKRLLPLLTALMVVFCTACKNYWMIEITEPLFIKKLADWTKAGGTTDNDYFTSVAYGNGRFVAGGASAAGSNTWCKIAYSSNGINWTEVTAPYFTGGIVESIVYGNGKFVALANNSSTLGQTATSSDGINWTLVTNSPFTDSISGIAYGNGKFVAVGIKATGAGGKIAYSSNGINWTEAKTTPDSYLNKIAYGNRAFFVVGRTFPEPAANTAYYSGKDGKWTKVNGTLFNNNSINGIAYGNGRFVIVGNRVVYCCEY